MVGSHQDEIVISYWHTGLGALSSCLGLRELQLWTRGMRNGLSLDDTDLRQLSALSGLNRLASPWNILCCIHLFTWCCGALSTTLQTNSYTLRWPCHLSCSQILKLHKSAKLLSYWCNSCSLEICNMLSLCVPPATAAWSCELAVVLPSLQAMTSRVVFNQPVNLQEFACFAKLESLRLRLWLGGNVSELSLELSTQITGASCFYHSPSFDRTVLLVGIDLALTAMA